jgi:tetratricopeptide (TPR) repeat protein
LFVKPIVMGKRIMTLLTAILFVYSTSAQEIKSLQKSFIEAEYFFVKEDYPDALSYYQQLYEKVPENANIAYRIGVCYLNIPGQKDLSISYLEKAVSNMSAKYKFGSIRQKSAPYDALYDLAAAYKINYQFDKAKETFSRYLETLSPADKENYEFVTFQINSCDVAKELIASPVSFTEENIGSNFNDDKSDFNPVISADGKSFAFMVSMKFYDAIMLSRFENGKWSTPVNITPELQSDGDMYISCLSPDGKVLYLSKDDNLNSDIYTCTFDGIRWEESVRLNKNINTKYWESHGFVSEDGEQLVFASDRPGGYGGLDLYISRKVNGDWGPPVNLGPVINTPFNEDRPFLINKGNTLFFSSQGHLNLGGYDLFRSDLRPDGTWSTPENLGYPLNTPDDDVFFMPVGNGKSGYYSIYKGSEGFGKEDIYLITFNK